MTDLERSIQFFKSLGYEEVPKSNHALRGKQYYIERERPEAETLIIFGDGDPIFGYGDFGFKLGYDKDGKFLGHGAFE